MNAYDLLPLALALVLGGLIGLEREHHGRAAGLRTHILVCLSATMLMVVSRELASTDVGGGRLVFDPNRMAAGIVTGIGFLGAGTVLRSGDVLRGLTTAACIWFVAGLGIVLGAHEYGLAVIATAIALFVLIGMNRLDDHVKPTMYRRLIVDAAVPEVSGLVAAVRAELVQRRMRVLDVASAHTDGGERCSLVFFLSMKRVGEVPELTQTIARIEGVESARWKSIV